MHDIDKILTKLLLEEELTDLEEKTLHQWLANSESNQTALKHIEGYWEHQKSINNHQKQKVWDKVEKVISTRDKKTTLVKVAFKSVKNYWKVASVVLVVCAIWAMNQYQDSFNQSKSISIIDPSFAESKNTRGERRTLKLSDGTIIKLNTESKLKFPKVFRSGKREVYLEGEAFFEVAKDSLHPFIINSGNIVTTVKGTSFNIRAYSYEKDIAVSVVSGLVEVASEEKQRFELLPGEKIAYNIESKVISKTTFDLKEIAWREGILLFEGADMKEIITKLEKWYGVTFEIKDNRILQVKDFSGEYKNKTLTNILENLSFAGAFNYDILGKRVVLY